MGASAKAVDFSDVKDRGAFNPKRVAEGDYAATITKVEDAKVADSGDFMYVFTIKLKKFSQNSYPYRCKLEANQLWKLRNIAVAAGQNVPKKRLKFDPNKLVGKDIGVTMEDDEYQGRPKSEISSVFPMSELADGADDFDDSETDTEFEEGAPVAAATDDDFDPEDEAGSEDDKPKKSKKDKGEKKKKGKKNKDVEDMDISDV
jgi:hypothetical protein